LSHVAADEVAAALERALAVDPAERYPSAADLVDALAPPLRTVRTTAGSRRRGAPVSPPLLPLEPDESGHGPESRGQGPEARDQAANPAADGGSGAESGSESAAAAPAAASEPPRAAAGAGGGAAGGQWAGARGPGARGQGRVGDSRRRPRVECRERVGECCSGASVGIGTSACRCRGAVSCRGARPGVITDRTCGA